MNFESSRTYFDELSMLLTEERLNFGGIYFWAILLRGNKHFLNFFPALIICAISSFTWKNKKFILFLLNLWYFLTCSAWLLNENIVFCRFWLKFLCLKLFRLLLFNFFFLFTFAFLCLLSLRFLFLFLFNFLFLLFFMILFFRSFCLYFLIHFYIL